MIFQKKFQTINDFASSELPHCRLGLVVHNFHHSRIISYRFTFLKMIGPTQLKTGDIFMKQSIFKILEGK